MKNKKKPFLESFTASLFIQHLLGLSKNLLHSLFQASRRNNTPAGSHGSHGGSYRLSQSSVGSTSSRTNHETTASPIELEDGRVEVGKITFDPAEILGKGCEGTFVYK